MNDEFSRSSCLFLFICVFFLSFTTIKGYGQTLPVGLLENVEDAYRRQQLISYDSSGVSYMIRPVGVSPKKEGKLVIYPLPVVWKTQLNSHHPFGMNDGLMIPAKGLQTQFSAGFFAKAGPLSIQLRPEFVYAQNSDYRQLYENGIGGLFAVVYASYSNSIDEPTRFGNSSYNKLDWGQSSIRLTFDPVSIGLSNENLWWGPGSRNSLLMSNNAPGFKHITLNTSKPIKSAIGSFEAQIIGGRLENSGIAPYEAELFEEKPDDWRYISGLAVTYQPKWLKGLFLGLDRTFVVYNKDMGNGFSDYFPLFSSPVKEGVITPDDPNLEDDKKRDQYASAFMRYVFFESRAEIYFQYGRNDFPANVRDAVGEPEHSRAYIAGMKKLIALPAKESLLEFAVETTHMEGSATEFLREQPNWYKHRAMPAGYTHYGQVLGAGIGSEANLQSFELSWIKGVKRIGMRVEHLSQNADLAKYGERWTDLSFAGRFDWNWKQFMLNSQLVYIRSNNYQYIDQQANNLHLQIGILYDFK
ncbi:MAG TPA: capsule assembly Wzi family protein [Pedobacter sp.]|nr:capsule assembly Wzi family protein [Pedobacter sp.]